MVAMFEKHWIKLGGILAFLGSFIVYFITLCPTTFWYDSGEFIAQGYTLGTAHPTGYPLWGIVSRFFMMLPFEWSEHHWAFMANLTSAVFAALGVYFTYWITFHLIEKREKGTNQQFLVVISSLVAALLLAFTGHFWNNANVAEVYSLNLFFVSLTCYLLLQWEMITLQDKKRDSLVILVVYLWSIGLTNHMSIVLLFPAFLFFILWSDRTILLRWKTLLAIVAVFLFGLTIYIYLPLRSVDSTIKWFDITSIEDFLYMVQAKSYQATGFSFDKAWEGLTKHLNANLSQETFAVGEFENPLRSGVFSNVSKWYPAALIALFGLFFLIISNIKHTFLFLLIFLSYLIYMASYQPQNRDFLLPVYMCASVAMGLGTYFIAYSIRAFFRWFLSERKIRKEYSLKVNAYKKALAEQKKGSKKASKKPEAQAIHQLPEEPKRLDEIDYSGGLFSKPWHTAATITVLIFLAFPILMFMRNVNEFNRGNDFQAWDFGEKMLEISRDQDAIILFQGDSMAPILYQINVLNEQRDHLKQTFIDHLNRYGMYKRTQLTQYLDELKQNNFGLYRLFDWITPTFEEEDTIQEWKNSNWSFYRIFDFLTLINWKTAPEWNYTWIDYRLQEDKANHVRFAGFEELFDSEQAKWTTDSILNAKEWFLKMGETGRWQWPSFTTKSDVKDIYNPIELADRNESFMDNYVLPNMNPEAASPKPVLFCYKDPAPAVNWPIKDFQQYLYNKSIYGKNYDFERILKNGEETFVARLKERESKPKPDTTTATLTYETLDITNHCNTDYHFDPFDLVINQTKKNHFPALPPEGKIIKWKNNDVPFKINPSILKTQKNSVFSTCINYNMPPKVVKLIEKPSAKIYFAICGGRCGADFKPLVKATVTYKSTIHLHVTGLAGGLPLGLPESSSEMTTTKLFWSNKEVFEYWYNGGKKLFVPNEVILWSGSKDTYPGSEKEKDSAILYRFSKNNLIWDTNSQLITIVEMDLNPNLIPDSLILERVNTDEAGVTFFAITQGIEKQ